MANANTKKPINADALVVPAKWTDDCQGKKDFDGDVISFSTRYWPRGGGFHISRNGSWEGNETRPEIRPSAHVAILLHHGEDDDGGRDYITLCEDEFEGDTFEEVKAKVEEWCRIEYRALVATMLMFHPEAHHG